MVARTHRPPVKVIRVYDDKKKITGRSLGLDLGDLWVSCLRGIRMGKKRIMLTLETLRD